MLTMTSPKQVVRIYVIFITAQFPIVFNSMFQWPTYYMVFCVINAGERVELIV
jgi:hypothetical protein